MHTQRRPVTWSVGVAYVEAGWWDGGGVRWDGGGLGLGWGGEDDSHFDEGALSGWVSDNSKEGG